MEVYTSQIHCIWKLSSLDIVREYCWHCGKYDLIVTQDVLEQVESSVTLAEEIMGALKEYGIMVLANCFKLVINV